MTTGALAVAIPDPEQVPMAIAAARHASGLTQKEMASRISASLSTVKRWEEGESEPSLEDLIEAFKACGYTLVAIHSGPPPSGGSSL